MARKRAALKEAEQQEGGQPDRRRPFNTRLDADIVLQAQIRCLQEGIFMNDIIEELLGLWLADKVKVNAGARNANGN